jgi:Ni,Fe-hydrogenase I cytochrome b subunit
MGNYLKEIIAVCATIITGLKLYLEGDGTTLVALFTLYGALFGWDMGSITQKKATE